MLPPTGEAIPPSSPSTPLLERFRWQALAVGLLVLIAYANSLGSSFHFDDAAIFTNQGIVSPGFGWNVFRLGQTRPLTYLTFHWNYLAGGQNPLLYHWVNLLLHAGNCILLLALARRYLSSSTAVCVAVLFALHPLQTESVTYVFERATLLSTHFALWTLWFHSRGKYLESAGMFALSLLAKEEAVALPVFLLLLDLFEGRRPKIPYFAVLAGFDLLAAGHLIYAVRVSPFDPGIGRVAGVSALDYLLTQSRVLWIYLRLIVAPIGLNLDHDVPFSTGLLAPRATLAAIVALAALIAGLLWLAWKKHPAALWALGFFLLIAPSSSIIPQSDSIFEHRTYLPLISMAIALGFLLESIPRPLRLIACAVLIPAMLAGTISRNAVWHDDRTLWTDIAAKSPNKGRAWLGMASAYRNDPAQARQYLMKGLSVDPVNAELHNSLGVRLMSLNQPAEALVHFQRNMALTGASANNWNNIGGAYYQMGNADRSLDAFERALQLDPCSFNARRNVMMVHSQRHEPKVVWQVGQLPLGCRMLPSQASELEILRRRAGEP